MSETFLRMDLDPNLTFPTPLHFPSQCRLGRHRFIMRPDNKEFRLETAHLYECGTAGKRSASGDSR